MDVQIYGALIGLALVVITAIGTIVKALTGRIVTDLNANTQLTRETREAANGRLGEALRLLDAERGRVNELRDQLQQRDDQVAFLRSRVSTAAVSSWGRRQGDDAIDDPTGTDAGAHPNG